jgi:Tol biopolymer transport system component
VTNSFAVVLLTTACTNLQIPATITQVATPQATLTPTLTVTTTLTLTATPSLTATASPTPTPIIEPTLEGTPTPIGGGDGTYIAMSPEFLPSIVLLDSQGSVISTLVGSSFSSYQDYSHSAQAAKWSPNGKRIVYMLHTTDGLLYRSDIYVMNADGTGQTRLTFNQWNQHADQPVWLPDGKHIVFRSYQTPWDASKEEFYEINIDGSGITRLTIFPPNSSSPAWSLDGKWVAFDQRRQDGTDLYVMKADGTDIKQLTSLSGRAFNTLWSPDSSKIVFSYQPDLKHTDHCEVYIVNADGTGLTQLTDTPGIVNIASAWSPDGKLIAFQTNRNNDKREICLMNADGTNPRLFLPNAFFGLSWRPAVEP